MKNTAQLDNTFVPVIFGSDINAYGIARSFNEAYGLQSVVISKLLLGPCRNTKFISRVITKSDIEEENVFLETLKSLADDEQYDDKPFILVPCGDSYSELISKLRDDLSPRFKFVTVNYDLHKKLNRKKTFYEICDEHGIPRPETQTVNKVNYRTEQLTLDYPVIIKPANSILYWKTSFPGKRKVFLARDKSDYDKILDAIYKSKYDDELILQEYITGEEEAELHVYSNQKGIVQIAQFDKMVLGSPTPDGIGSHTAEIITHNPEMSDRFTRLLNALKYRGYSNIDLKYDPKRNDWVTFEVNLRPARCSFALSAAGNDVVKFLVEDVLYNKNVDIVPLEKDILYTIIPNRLLRKYIRPPLLDEVNQLLKEKRVVRHYLPKSDYSIKRITDHLRNQRAYYGIFRKYFGKSMYTDL